MTTIRVEKKKNFSTIPNGFLNDTRLSWRAKGVLAYLLSKPDDWQVRVTDLVARGKDGRDAIYATLDELSAFGYVEKSKDRGQAGRFAGYSYLVREEAVALAGDVAHRNGFTVSGETVSGATVSGEARHILKTEDNQRLSRENTESFSRARESSGLTSPYNLSAIRQSRNGKEPADRTTHSAVAEREEDTPLPPSRAVQYIPNWLRAWYAVYPLNRRIPVMEALALFRTAESDPDALLPTTDEQITILRAYCATEGWQKNAGQYVPSMRRYITERMWEHDPDPMSLWRRDGNIYPIYIRGKGLTWPPGYKPPEGATQMSRVLNEAGEWINNPMLY